MYVTWKDWESGSGLFKDIIVELGAVSLRS